MRSAVKVDPSPGGAAAGACARTTAEEPRTRARTAAPRPNGQRRIFSRVTRLRSFPVSRKDRLRSSVEQGPPAFPVEPEKGGAGTEQGSAVEPGPGRVDSSHRSVVA